MTSWRFRALDLTAEVRSTIPELDTRLEALLGGYQQLVGAQAHSRYLLTEEGARYELRRDHQSRYQGHSKEELLDFFQIELYRRIVKSSPRRWLLHAAALCQSSEALVLTGPSNAGKSTLCRALMSRGWTYLSEEIASLGMTGQGSTNIDALRRPLHLESPEQLAGLAEELEPVLLRAAESPAWIAKAPPWPPALCLQDLRVAAIVRVQYRPGQATEMRLLDDLAAREELWPCRMNTGLKVAQLAARVMAQTPCYRLDAADRQSALAALIEISRG